MKTTRRIDEIFLFINSVLKEELIRYKNFFFDFLLLIFVSLSQKKSICTHLVESFENYMITHKNC